MLPRAALLLLAIACSSSAERPAVPVDAGVAARPPAKPKVVPGTPVVPAPIGVEACDRFAARVASCIAHQPEAERRGAQKSLEDMMSAWREIAAADPDGFAKQTIGDACREAMAAEARTAGSRCPGVSFAE